MENKIKHLEFIQKIIERRSNNTFLVKGWTMAIFATLFSLAIKDNNNMYLIVIVLPVVIFWVIDGYFLMQERLFRELYDKVRVIKLDTQIDFAMNIEKPAMQKLKWFLTSLLSTTNTLFYGSLLVTTVIFIIK